MHQPNRVTRSLVQACTLLSTLILIFPQGSLSVPTAELALSQSDRIALTHSLPLPSQFSDPPTGAPASEPALTLDSDELAALPEYEVVAEEAFQIPGNPLTGSYPAAADDPEHITLFLDFGGEEVMNTRWNDLYDTPLLAFTPAILAEPETPQHPNAFVTEVWASVAEDYAPFDVNVTITEPAPSDMVKSSPEDRRFGVHVVITDSYEDILPGVTAAGLAFVGTAGTQYGSPALVFTTPSGGGDPAQASAKVVGEAAAHEAGHTLGLTHHGIHQEEYFFPSMGVWAPTMGAGYAVPLTQWSAGEYTGATNAQHDLDTLTDPEAEHTVFLSLENQDGSPFMGESWCPAGPIEYGVDYMTPHLTAGCALPGDPIVTTWDHHGRLSFRDDQRTPGAGPTPTPFSLQPTVASQRSVIRSPEDRHRYQFTTASGGTVTASVDVAAQSPNLNAQISLLSENGTLLAAANPEVRQEYDPESPGLFTLTGLGATLTHAVGPGTYTLLVAGAGQGNPLSPEFRFWDPSEFTSTGSTGNYRLITSVSPTPGPVPGPAPAPPAEQTDQSDDSNPSKHGEHTRRATLQTTGAHPTDPQRPASAQLANSGASMSSGPGLFALTAFALGLLLLLGKRPHSHGRSRA